MSEANTAIKIEKSGRRYYLLGNTYSIKDQLRNAGCNWDSDRRAWWTGKPEIAEKFVGEVKPAEKTQEEKIQERSKKPCTAKVQYKGKQYYVIGTSKDGSKLLLTPA
jgi:hypothetical protein